MEILQLFSSNSFETFIMTKTKFSLKFWIKTCFLGLSLFVVKFLLYKFHSDSVKKFGGEKSYENK